MCNTLFKGLSSNVKHICALAFLSILSQHINSSDGGFVNVGQVSDPSTIGSNPLILRMVSMQYFHVWKFVASSSSDGMSYRQLEAGLRLDDSEDDEGGRESSKAHVAM